MVEAVSRYWYLSKMRSLRQCFENVLNQTTRLLQLIESNRNARGNVTVGANDHLHCQPCIWLAGQVAAQIKRLATRPTCGSREARTCSLQGPPRRRR